VEETAEDLAELQALLDQSHDGAGEHLRSVITPERRMTAAEVAEALTGMRLLALATVTRRGEPRVAPVDAFFYRGRFWFGSSPTSARFRHLRRRPAVSATHVPDESLAVSVHGRAGLVDLSTPEHAGFRAICIGYYGPEWEEWGAGAPYARIDAHAMFTFRMLQPDA